MAWILRQRIAASAACGWLLGTAVLASAQTNPPVKPVIEVASIRPNQAGGRSGFRVEAGSGRPTMTNMTLRDLIRWAYGVEDYQISGGPKWIGSEAFDITAKLENDVNPAGDAVQREYFREMIRPLLADRFHLVFHRVTRELPVYALVMGKGGPRLPESPKDMDPRDMRMSGGSGLMAGQGIPLSILIEALRSVVGRPISDETGLTGRYNFRLQWNPADAAVAVGNDGQTEASLFTALQEQLGLRLDSRRGAVEVLVVDRAEIPAEN